MTKRSIPLSNVFSTPPPITENYGLLRGVSLEKAFSFRKTLGFFLYCFPPLWIGFMLFFAWSNKSNYPIVDGLAWSIVASFCLFTPYYFLRPLFSQKLHMQIEDRLFTIQTKTLTLFELPFEQPLRLKLLHRVGREDGLLIIQNYERKALYLYGRYRLRHELPPESLATDGFNFSLAAFAMDELGAYVLPDKKIEYLPHLCQHFYTAKGYRSDNFSLPLSQYGDQNVRLDRDFLTWQVQGEVIHKFSLSNLRVDSYKGKLIRGPEELQTIFLCIIDVSYYFEDDEMQDSIEYTGENLSLEDDGESISYTQSEVVERPPAKSLWIKLQWSSFPTDSLSPVPKKLVNAPISFSWIDTLLFLDYLSQKGIIDSPLSLFQLGFEEEVSGLESSHQAE